MSRQQGRIEVMNSLAQQFPFEGNSSLMIIMDERLKAVNSLWQDLQNRAASKQSDLESYVHSQPRTKGRLETSDMEHFKENFALLRSLNLSNASDDIASLEENGLFDEYLENGVEDDNLAAQIELHELLDGVASIEEALVSEEIVDGDMAVLKLQLEHLQVSKLMNEQHVFIFLDAYKVYQKSIDLFNILHLH